MTPVEAELELKYFGNGSTTLRCVLCGREFKNAAELIAVDPVAASQGGETVACRSCWESNKLIQKGNI